MTKISIESSSLPVSSLISVDDGCTSLILFFSIPFWIHSPPVGWNCLSVDKIMYVYYLWLPSKKMNPIDFIIWSEVKVRLLILYLSIVSLVDRNGNPKAILRSGLGPLSVSLGLVGTIVLLIFGILFAPNDQKCHFPKKPFFFTFRPSRKDFHWHLIFFYNASSY